jgi:hypothetical protein
LAVVQREGPVDLEAVESALRCALLQAGARLLETLLEPVGVGRRVQPVRCRCGARMESCGCKTKTLVTVLGEVRFTRSLFQCPRCGKTRFPGDEELGVVDTSRSPGVQRLVARFAAKEPFEAAADDLREAAGIALSVKDVERIAERLGEEIRNDEDVARREQRRQVEAGDLIGTPVDTLYVEFDGTGIPMVPAAVKDRPGKQPDGTAKTREAKLGCVFTQTAFDADERPIRDDAATSFVGQIEDAQACGRRMYDEAVRRGLYQAKRVVVITDGAEWIRNQAALHFSQATHIVDFYHAREHVARLAKLLFANHPDQASAYDKGWGDLLKEGRVDEIVSEARTTLADQRRNPDKDTENEIGYLEKNRDRMHYGQYRAQGLFIGSGVIEAGCRHVIGQRFKQSGMFWSERGANNIVSLRCCILSNRFEDFWANRAEKRPITRAAA